MSQVESTNPFPWKVHRNWRGWPCWWQRGYEAWLVITGRYTFWHAWHDGKHRGSSDEYNRVIVNGGDLGPVIDAAIYATTSHVLNGSEPAHPLMSGFRRRAWLRYEADRAALCSLPSTPSKTGV